MELDSGRCKTCGTVARLDSKFCSDECGIADASARVKLLLDAGALADMSRTMSTTVENLHADASDISDDASSVASPRPFTSSCGRCKKVLEARQASVKHDDHTSYARLACTPRVTAHGRLIASLCAH